MNANGVRGGVLCAPRSGGASRSETGKHSGYLGRSSQAARFLRSQAAGAGTGFRTDRNLFPGGSSDPEYASPEQVRRWRWLACRWSRPMSSDGTIWARVYEHYLAEEPGIALQRIRPQDRSSRKDFSIVIDGARFGVSRDFLCAALEKENV